MLRESQAVVERSAVFAVKSCELAIDQQSRNVQQLLDLAHHDAARQAIAEHGMQALYSPEGMIRAQIEACAANLGVTPEEAREWMRMSIAQAQRTDVPRSEQSDPVLPRE